jgi:hypothetical protein
MSINWIKKYLFLLCFFPIFCFAQFYSELYPKECEAAKQFFAEHKKEFEQAGKNTGLSVEFLFAVVAPEVTQFSHLSNKLETYSLKVMYVQGGTAYANFSIGYFQMKPSFIERLEEYAAADTILKTKYAACLFVNPSERASRVARIDRLNTVEWQITYLTLFCEVLQKQFGNVLFTTAEEQLRFYASAYNCGFHKTEQQIKETEQKALFPHFSRKKFKYSNIAVWFYGEVLK